MSLRDASCRSKKKKWDAARFAQLLTIPIDRDAVNAADEYHRTPLLLAASLGTFFFFLALKCSGSKCYFTSGLLCEVKALIAAGADPNVTSVRGISPLAYATHQGNVKLMEVLIHAGANVKERGLVDGALLSHNHAASRMLLERGAIPTKKAAAYFSRQILIRSSADMALIGLVASVGGMECV